MLVLALRVSLLSGILRSISRRPKEGLSAASDVTGVDVDEVIAAPKTGVVVVELALPDGKRLEASAREGVPVAPPSASSWKMVAVPGLLLGDFAPALPEEPGLLSAASKVSCASVLGNETG